MMSSNGVTDNSITTWRQFTQIVRSKGCQLLKRLDEFPNSVLVTGCQRSGTTMLARIITQSAGMTNYWFGKDDELDAALILSGYVPHVPDGRYCFQTTYVDECYHEYYEHGESFKIIWVIRNPYSVAYSLMHNWGMGALEGTFNKMAASELKGINKLVYQMGGSKWIRPVHQAGLVYNAKTLQLLELAKRFERDRLFIVDYDELVQNRDTCLREIYRFIKLDYSSEYGERIHTQSVSKKKQLSSHEQRIIHQLCEPVYQQARSLKNVIPGGN